MCIILMLATLEVWKMRLEINYLKKSYGKQEVLHGISFAVEQGRALGLLGRNGAGKTTTIRILMDVFKANSGTITLDGQPFNRKAFQIGYLPEERGLYPKKTVYDQLLYFGRLRGLNKAQVDKNIDYYLNRLEIMEYKHRKLETLSKGNQQKVQLAQTLIADPDIVIFDEPFSGLDPVNAQLLKDVVKDCIAMHKFVIFSSHQMSYVEEFCQDIVIIHHGEVVLKGDLNTIKREFGHGRYFLKTDQNISQLNNLTLIQSIHAHGDGYVLTAIDNVSLEMVLQEILRQGITIQQFGYYEPTLTEIFVAKAGDEA